MDVGEGLISGTRQGTGFPSQFMAKDELAKYGLANPNG